MQKGLGLQVNNDSFIRKEEKKIEKKKFLERVG